MTKYLMFPLQLIFVFIGLIASEPSCTPPDRTCGDFIPAAPNTYDAQILMINPEATRIEYIHELFDRPNLRGRISILRDGKEQTYIYDYKKQVSLDLLMDPTNYKVASSCVVTPLNDTHNFPMNSLLGVTDPNGKTAHMFTGGGALHMNPDLRFQYIKNDTLRIRRIHSEQWESCILAPEVNGSFLIDYYWSKAEGSSSDNPPRVPLRALINGSYQSANYQRQLTHYYDFMWFDSNPTFTNSMFEPIGVYCSGYDSKKPFPPLPDRFAFRLEFLLDPEKPNSNKVGLDYKVWYDRKHGIVRYDFKPFAGADLWKFGASELSKIIDYNTGTVYIVDTTLGNCTVRPLQSQDFPFPDDAMKANETIPSPENVLMLKVTEYEYTGQEMVRDILCDIWIGVADNTTIEWFFLADSWDYDDGQMVERQIPVQLITRKSDDGMNLRSIYNFFQFLYDPDGFPFNIGTCFTETQQRHFQIGFPGRYYKVYQENSNIFVNTSRITLSEILRINIIRVTDLQVDYNENLNTLYLEFTLLEKSQNTATDSESSDLGSAINLLVESVNNNRSTIKLPESFPVKDRFVTAIPNSVLELDSRGRCEAVEIASSTSQRQTVIKRRKRDASAQNEDDTNNFSQGEMAGLAVGMLVVGGLMGFTTMLIVLHFFRRNGRQDNQRIIYNRHRDSDPSSPTKEENAGTSSSSDLQGSDSLEQTPP